MQMIFQATEGLQLPDVNKQPPTLTNTLYTCATLKLNAKFN